MQILDAISGAGLVSLYSEQTINAAVHHLHHLPGKDEIHAETVLLIILYEFLASSLLVLVVLNTAIDRVSRSIRSFSPRFTVTASILATFHFTGGSVNPAQKSGTSSDK